MGLASNEPSLSTTNNPYLDQFGKLLIESQRRVTMERSSTSRHADLGPTLVLG